MKQKPSDQAPTSEPSGFHEFPNIAPSGSKEEDALGDLRRERMLSKKHWLKPGPGNWSVDLPAVMLIVCNPTHPKNGWKYLVETVEIYGETYLRLVDRIPLGVKKQWEESDQAPKLDAVWGWSPSKEADEAVKPERPPEDEERNNPEGLLPKPSRRRGKSILHEDD
jgi:hypothetical protein